MTPGDLATPQVVDRGPHVSPYRARKPPEAIEVHLCGYGPGILVLRCHDVSLAIDVLLDDRSDLTASPSWISWPVEPIWVRWVPEDYDEPTGPGSYERELRGTIGATPAVLFARPNPATRRTPNDPNL